MPKRYEYGELWCWVVDLYVSPRVLKGEFTVYAADGSEVVREMNNMTHQTGIAILSTEGWEVVSVQPSKMPGDFTVSFRREITDNS